MTRHYSPTAALCGLFAVLLVSAGCTSSSTPAGSSDYVSANAAQPTAGTRHWLGPGYWGNRLHDWQFNEGRFECITPQGWLEMRTLHDVTRQVTNSSADFEASVVLSLPEAEGDSYPSDAGAGMLVGVGRGEMDYRSAAIVHQWSGYGAGLFVGIDNLGQCFILDNEQPWTLGGGFDASKAIDRSRWEVTADSFEQNMPPRNAIDGDPSTIWHTEFSQRKPPHPHDLTINLSKRETFSALAYLPRQNNDSGRIGKFEIYTSLDGNLWGEPIATGELPNSAALQVIEFPETTAQYIKLVANSAQNPQPATTVAEVWLLEEFIKPDDAKAGLPEQVSLKITGESLDEDTYGLTVRATDPATGKVISSASKTVSPDRVLGNLALVSHPGKNAEGKKPALFSFEDWSLAGDAIEHRPEQALGPILGTQYTLTRGVLKMTAQLMPLSADDPLSAELLVNRGDGWEIAATAPVQMPSYTATFRVENWDDTQQTPYRVVYRLPDGEQSQVYRWAGTVRRDPVEKPEIVVAGFTGNHMNSRPLFRQKWDGDPASEGGNWVLGMYFPHADLTQKIEQHKPDLLFFSGDQVYEGSSPTFPDRANIEMDYLYKWYMFVISYRDLMKDIPTVTIPDDHDVYQGNVWGQGGRKSPGRDHDGGYVHPASFVNLVHSTQTSHLPDPTDATPIEQGISYYTSDVHWGRVSFAVLADRMFKNGCNGQGLPPSGTGRPDHYNNPTFDTADLDIDGMKLLGDRQLDFLDHWAGDWKGVDMKMALSQTVFANLGTHHGPDLFHLIADLDSNGWPQTGRNKAMASLRKAFAMHLAGDQHLATLVHHGIDDHKDAVWSFCVPSVANFYPRAWAPEIQNPYRVPKPEEYLGDRLDGFKNKITVYAAANPGNDMGHEPKTLHDNMPGYGIVVVNKDKHTYQAQCWPRFADPTDPSQQYPGWPRTIDQLSNYGKEPAGYLPTLEIAGLENPVVHVIHEGTGELVYALRVADKSFKPMVFEDGKYNVIVSDPDQNVRRSLTGREIAEDGETLQIAF